MKEGINNLPLRRGSRSSVLNVFTNTQDYLITTMKLRDRVLTARAPVHGSHRKTIRQLRSAPPFQNRNLDNYPMPHNREDAVRSAHGQRAEKKEKTSRMVKERVDSGLMREYSKQMFDFTVKSIHNSNGYRNGYDKSTRVPSRTKSEQEYSAVLRTNGPTPDGSILHNRKQKVLNSIRIRPHVEYENKFHHERTCSRLSLQHTINDKNRHYRVRSVTESSRPVSVAGNASILSGDIIFEPLDQSSQSNGVFQRNQACQRHVTLDTPLSTYDDTDSIEGVFGKDPFDDIDGRTNTTAGEFRRSNREAPSSVSTLLPPDVSCNLRLVSLDEESSSESEEEKEEPVPEVKKPEPPPPPSKPAGRGKKNTKITFVEEEKNKVPEPEPEPEPVKVKLILKGPHCWVDDATVSSDQSDHEDDPEDTGNILAQNPQPNGNTETLNNAPKVDNPSKTKTLLKNDATSNIKTSISASIKQSKQQTAKESFDKALQNVQSKPNGIANSVVNNIETLEKNTEAVEIEVTQRKQEEICEENNENKVELPPFICPSSEKKSRQAALKDWLAHTCFETGQTGVPIV